MLVIYQCYSASKSNGFDIVFGKTDSHNQVLLGSVVTDIEDKNNILFYLIRAGCSTKSSNIDEVSDFSIYILSESHSMSHFTINGWFDGDNIFLDFGEYSEENNRYKLIHESSTKHFIEIMNKYT